MSDCVRLLYAYQLLYGMWDVYMMRARCCVSTVVAVDLVAGDVDVAGVVRSALPARCNYVEFHVWNPGDRSKHSLAVYLPGGNRGADLHASVLPACAMCVRRG